MSATRLKIFISSVQKEFAQQRLDLKAFLLGDAILRRFVSEVFLFEEIPAKDRRADQVYLEEVEHCDIYLGLFGYEYGNEDPQGVSATEYEYNHATRLGKTRLIYVWGADEKRRAAKMKKLVSKAGSALIRRRIEDASALTSEVYASLVDYLDTNGALRVPPFDTAACHGAGLKDLSRKRIDWFLEAARRERGFPLKSNTSTQALLTHLNLLDDGKPTNAAILLFGTNPQRFHRTAETKCIHCHGTAYRRPFASMQVYGGDLFEQADQTQDFILGKINRAIGTRATSITAPATYELPPDAVAEAIINAIAHRDYHSNASVEVRLFADRLEIWNPGMLPGTLTLDSLRDDHPSVPNNPLIAESLYLTRYIERVGSGTQTMIDLCREAGLPEPQFEQRSGSFVITLWRDWLTAEVLAELDLNNRQVQAVEYVKSHERITNAEYQRVTGSPQRTATRDLNELVQKGVLELEGKGRGAQYRLLQKRARNAPNAPSEEI
jgi:DNA-binding transcriptional ArsR family regulator